MSVGAALVASFLVTLARPATWSLALAAFLVRGGVVLVLAPIVVIPSAVGVANAVGPILTALVLSGVDDTMLVLAGVGGTAGFAWILVGGLIAASAEAELVRIVATDEEVVLSVPRPDPISSRSGMAWRILAVRVIALAPLAVALVWGCVQIVTSAYRELTVPSETGTPLIVRVLRDTPEAVAVILLAWLLGQTVAAIAVRCVVEGGDGVPGALTHAVVRFVRRPVRMLVVETVPLLALIMVLVPSAAASASTWDAIRMSIADERGPFLTIGVVGLFVGLWIGGLLLIGAVSAWRAAAWTVALAGTFGAIPTGREGDLQPSTEPATLADLRSRGIDPDTRENA